MIKTQILHNNEIVEGGFKDLGEKRTTIWVDVSNPTKDEFKSIASHVGVSDQELSELLDIKQRPLLHDVGDFTAAVCHVPETEKEKILIRPYVLLASKEQKDFISLHPGSTCPIEKINSYNPKRRVEIFQKGSTALLFAALDELVSNSFATIDYLGEQISNLEEHVFQLKNSSALMRKVFLLKKDLIYIQRALASDREVVSEIDKAYGKFLDVRQIANFRLLYSDVTQLLELANTYRDILISAIEVHLSSMSNSLNVVMKKLTSWAAIILVPSLIAGIYGMNFLFLPFAKSPFGFWAMLGFMAVSVGLLYAYFKKHDWI